MESPTPVAQKVLKKDCNDITMVMFQQPKADDQLHSSRILCLTINIKPLHSRNI